MGEPPPGQKATAAQGISAKPVKDHLGLALQVVGQAQAPCMFVGKEMDSRILSHFRIEPDITARQKRDGQAGNLGQQGGNAIVFTIATGILV